MVHRWIVTGALVTGAAWLTTGCGDDDSSGGNVPGSAGAGGASGGSGAEGGETTDGGDGGETSPDPSTGGTDAGMGGTAGTNTGPVAGSGGTPEPPPGPCDGEELKSLPYEIAQDFWFLNTIGASEDSEFKPVANPDCDAPIILSDGGIPDGGVGPTDAGSPGGSMDASVPSADGGVMDGGSGDAGWVIPECWAFDYTPNDLPDIDWGGVIFQPNDNAQGDQGEAVCIELGATLVTFMARADRAGARIKFGSTREGLNVTEFFMPIATEWAEYSVPIPAGEDYNIYAVQGGVWKGFTVVAEPQDHEGGTRIWVKDIVWEVGE